jgi:hypothetical protein
MSGDRAISSSMISVMALSAWLGATILTAAVVAPAAFAVLPTRSLAGAVVGRVLPVLFYGGAAIGIATALLGRSATASSTRLVLAGIMTATCLVAQLLVAPRIERVRAAAGRPIDELTAGDPRRTAFGRLHGASVLLLGMAAMAGGAALALTLRIMPRGNTTREPFNSPSEH